MAIDTKLFDGIVIFHQVVTLGSFSAVAEESGHSTSFISKEVNKLEARLSVRLLNRTTRSLSLTPEGKQFFEQCKQLVSDAEMAIDVINHKNQTPHGLLKISCPVTFGTNTLQPILSKYMYLYPGVTLEMDFDDRHVDVVQEGFDVVIRATQNLDDSSLICKKIADYKSYAIASPGYLNKFGEPKEAKELVNHQCICYSNHKNPEKWRFTRKNGSHEQIEVKPTILCNNAEMELAMVLDHHGICRLPEFYLGDHLGKGSLKPLFEDYEFPTVSIYAIYPSKKHLSPKVRCLIDMLVESLNPKGY